MFIVVCFTFVLSISDNCDPIVGLDAQSIVGFLQSHQGSPLLATELGEYVQGRVVECMVTRSCGASVIQSLTCEHYSNPQCLIPSFNASCTKCVDISTQTICEMNVLSCWWKEGKCVDTNCPQLFKYQHDKFKMSGMTPNEYMEFTHAKEAEAITKRVCKNQGCVYSPSTHWCSSWSQWELHLTIVACALLVVASILGVVILFMKLRKSPNRGKDRMNLIEKIQMQVLILSVQKKRIEMFFK